MRQKKTSIFSLFYPILAIAITLNACQSETPTAPIPAASDPIIKKGPAIKAWRDNKYALFIHFGAYSTLGGMWNQKKVTEGSSEEIWSHTGISTDEYEKIARDFNPYKWNPDSVAKLANDAGMRSIVITAKNHDGFCLFKTNTTSFNLVDFTTYRKDLIEGLAAACKRHKLNLGIYFSVTDWHLPAAVPPSSHNADSIPPAHHQINMEQVRELLTHYGPISEIWFDMGDNTPQQSRELCNLVHQLQPQCLVGGHVGNDQGDFNVMTDNYYPNFKMDFPWQTPASMFEGTWGYRSWQKRGQSLQKAKAKVRDFIHIVAHGGNYLLNIGPKGDGSLVDFESEVLRHIGQWIEVNKEAIFASSPGPFPHDLPFGQVTQKENKLFLFVDTIPTSYRLALPGLTNKVKNARFLGSGIPVEWTQSETSTEILWTNPAMADPMEMPVIEITLDGPASIKYEPITYNREESLTLTPENAQLIRSFTGADYYTFVPCITGMRWHLKPTTDQLQAEILFSEYEKGRTIECTIGKQVQTITLNGEERELICTPKDSIKIAPPFRSKEFFGALSEVTINPKGTFRKEVARGDWMRADEIKAQGLHPLPRTTHYHFLKITSENAQQYAFSISGNDGLQVWINGHEQLLDRNQDPTKQMNRILVLSLKKGTNQLLIKNYNRHGNIDHFALKPLPAAKWYSKKLPLSVSSEDPVITLRPHKPLTPNSPIDLPNIRIYITPSEKGKE